MPKRIKQRQKRGCKPLWLSCRLPVLLITAAALSFYALNGFAGPLPLALAEGGAEQYGQPADSTGEAQNTPGNEAPGEIVKPEHNPNLGLPDGAGDPQDSLTGNDVTGEEAEAGGSLVPPEEALPVQPLNFVVTQPGKPLPIVSLYNNHYYVEDDGEGNYRFVWEMTGDPDGFDFSGDSTHHLFFKSNDIEPQNIDYIPVLLNESGGRFIHQLTVPQDVFTDANSVSLFYSNFVDESTVVPPKALNAKKIATFFLPSVLDGEHDPANFSIEYTYDYYDEYYSYITGLTARMINNGEITWPHPSYLRFWVTDTTTAYPGGFLGSYIFTSQQPNDGDSFALDCGWEAFDDWLALLDEADEYTYTLNYEAYYYDSGEVWGFSDSYTNRELYNIVGGKLAALMVSNEGVTLDWQNLRLTENKDPYAEETAEEIDPFGTDSRMLALRMYMETPLYNELVIPIPAAQLVSGSISLPAYAYDVEAHRDADLGYDELDPDLVINPPSGGLPDYWLVRGGQYFADIVYYYDYFEIPEPAIARLSASSDYRLYDMHRWSNNLKNITFTLKSPSSLTAGTVSRASHTAASVTFNSDFEGAYWYMVMEAGSSEPLQWEIQSYGTTGPMVAGTNTLQLTLTEGAKDFYIIGNNCIGDDLTTILKISIPAYNIPEPAPFPVLIAGAVNRTSHVAASASFSSDQPGWYAYLLYEAGEAAPSQDYVWEMGQHGEMVEGANTLQLNLAEGAKDLYVMGMSAQERWSDVLKISIPAYSVSKGSTDKNNVVAEDLPYTPIDKNDGKAEVTKEGAVTALTHNEDGKAVLTTTVAEYPITKAQEDGFATLVIDLTKHLDMVSEGELAGLTQRLLFPQSAFDSLKEDTLITVVSNNLEMTLTVSELKKGGGSAGLEIEFYEDSNAPADNAGISISAGGGLPVYFAASGQPAPLYVARDVRSNTRRVASNSFHITVSKVDAAGNKTAVTNFASKPVTVSIPASAIKTSSSSAVSTGGTAVRSSYVVKKYNEQTNSWENRPTVVTAQKVSFRSNTLSTFAIFEIEVEAGDVGADYEYADMLSFLVENGVVKGTDEGNVEPYRDITLAEMAALLTRLDNRPVDKFTTEYPGVLRAKWYYGELNTALARGYITEEETWRDPDAPMPLHYTSLMMYRYQNSQLNTPVEEEDGRQAALDFAATEQLFTPQILQDPDQPVSRENVFAALYKLVLRLFNIETAE